jgi:hypothetical protein
MMKDLTTPSSMPGSTTTSTSIPHGHGDRLCSGANIQMLSEVDLTSNTLFTPTRRELAEQTLKLVIAALNGHAVGGGSVALTVTSGSPERGGNRLPEATWLIPGRRHPAGASHGKSRDAAMIEAPTSTRPGSSSAS